MASVYGFFCAGSMRFQRQFTPAVSAMFWPVLPLRVAPAARTEPTSFQRTSDVTRSVEPPARTL